MRVTIQDGTRFDVTWIAAHMRDADWAEISCQIPANANRTYAASMCLYGSEEMYWTAWKGDLPVAAFGFTQTHPTLLSAWAFGTDGMTRAMPAISRHCVEFALPLIIARGFLRAEVRVMRDHKQSYRWLRMMGAKEDCVMQDYGRNGEAFALLSWDRNNLPVKYNVSHERKEAA